MAFPVESIALIYKDGHFLDEETAEFVAEEYARGHSFFTYISDTADSLSSCCFPGDMQIDIANKEMTIEKQMSFKDAYNEFGESPIMVYSYNPYTQNEEWREGNLIKPTTNEWLVFKMDNKYCPELRVTRYHILPVIRGDEMIDLFAENIEVGDKLIFDLTRYEASDERITPFEIIDVDYEQVDNEDCYCIEIRDGLNPYFTLKNGLITHNCRLKNKIQTREFSFTNGNMSVETGSKSVITLNINRIIQDWIRSANIDIKDVDIKESKEYFNEILERIYKYHIAYNELLWDMYDSRLLPVYDAGFISLDKQYLTFGINGLNQGAEFLGIECSNNEKYRNYCTTIFKLMDDFCLSHNGKYNGHKITLNVECVPAESIAIKNYNWDKADGYKVPNDTNLYASYIYKPNDSAISVLDKMVMHGNTYIGEYLSGGSAAHINLDQHLTVEQYRKLLKFAAENGCQYFTFNIPNCECADCGYITKSPITKCPKCNSTNIDYYDRVN